MILMDFPPILISIIFMLFSQTVSDEDLFEVGESCISKKTHFRFHLLFDYLWNEHRRWELVANPEERITRGIVVYLQNESRFLFFFFIPIYFKLVKVAFLRKLISAFTSSLTIYEMSAVENVANSEERINKNHGIVFHLQNQSRFLFFFFIPIYVCFVCMCVCFLWYENNK